MKKIINITIVVLLGLSAFALQDGFAATTDMLPVSDASIDFYENSGTYQVFTDVWFAPSHRRYPSAPLSSIARRAVLKFNISGLSLPGVEAARLWIRCDSLNGGSPYVIVDWVDARNTSSITAADHDSELFGRVGVLTYGYDELPQASNCAAWETIVIDPDIGPDPYLKTPHTSSGEVFDLGNDIARAVYIFDSPEDIRNNFDGGRTMFVQSATLTMALDSSSTSDPLKPLPGVRAYATNLADTSGGLGAVISADDWDDTGAIDLGMLVPSGDQPGGGTEYSLDVTASMNDFVENPTLGSYYAVRLKMEGEDSVSQDPSVDWAYALDGATARIECVMQSTVQERQRWYSVDITQQLQADITAGRSYSSFRLRLASDPYLQIFDQELNWNWYFDSSFAFNPAEIKPHIRYGDAFVPTPVTSTATSAMVVHWQSEKGSIYQIYYKDSMDDAVSWQEGNREYIGTGGIMSGADTNNPSGAVRRFYCVVKTEL